MRHDTACSARDIAQRARAGGLASEVYRDTKIVSWLEAALCRNRGSDTGCDTAQDAPRYGVVHAQHSAVGDLCRDTKKIVS